METIKVIAFAGSLRKASYNKKALLIAVEKLNTLGANVKTLDLNDFEIPIYNQEIEGQGMPSKTQAFKKELHNATGILIASPEYNGSYSGALKNAIDWASRQLHKDERMCEAFYKKAVGIISASPGNLGGLRGSMRLRELMQDIGSIVMPELLTIPSAHNMTDKEVASIEQYAERYLQFCQAVVNF